MGNDEKAAEALSEIFDTSKTIKEEFANRPLKGKTPLITAAENKKVKCMSILLSYGARIDKSFLIYFVKANNLEKVDWFFDNGGEFVATGQKGEESPAFIANSTRNVEIKRLILKHSPGLWFSLPGMLSDGRSVNPKLWMKLNPWGDNA